MENFRNRFQRYRARRREAEAERWRELTSLREEVARLQDFKNYMEQNHLDVRDAQALS